MKEKHCLFSISIVNHRHGEMISNLLTDIRKSKFTNYEIILTNNVPDSNFDRDIFSDLPIRFIDNVRPQGFGANHNAAFNISNGEYFTILNPDIRIRQFDLEFLASNFVDESIGCCAPLILNDAGEREDSARVFPNIFSLFMRFIFKSKSSPYFKATNPTLVDWVAGMFIMFPRKSFQKISGFDTRYFMYMEDVDICFRMQKVGYKVIYDPRQSAVHNAQRNSRKNFQHLIWHISSAIKFLLGSN